MLLFVVSTTAIFGQIKNDTIALSAVTLKGSPIKNLLQNTAASVSVITAADINKSDGIILTSVLNKIPGLTMQQGALNTNRITIRGIGARAQYGTNKIKAYFDGIPLTTGEGETTIDAIDLASIEKIEIIKGPNSTSFGSGLGGVIQLFSRETPLLASFGKATVTFGSFGLLQQRLSAGYDDSKTNIFSSYTDLQTDGFRANSSYNRKSLNLHGKQKMGSNGILSFLGTFTRLKAFIPSSINETDLKNSPEKAASTWAAAQGYESYDQSLFGLGYDHRFSEKWSMQTSVFSNFKDAYEPRPFDILKDKTSSVGFRSNVNYKDQVFSLPFELSFGSELLTENYKYSLFKNGYQSQPGQGSIQGDEFSAINQNRNYSNYFLQMELWISAKLHLETGVALNTTKYSLEDVFYTNSSGQKTPFTFGKVCSPRVGLSYKVSPVKNIFTSVSKGFSVPSVAETLTPEGRINTDLKPEIGVNYELGFKGNWLRNKVYTEVTFYTTQINNLLVARRTANDQYVGINAGSSSHSGLEFLVNYALLALPQLQITPYFSGAVNAFKFKEFLDGDADYSGNQLTGVPENQFNFGVDLNTKNGFTVNTSFRTMGAIPLNDSNTKYSERYALLDIKTTYVFTILSVLKTELNAGINNASNTKYAANILPNAVGFGTAAPRYFYPGNPVNWYGGFSVTYFF
ncbi:MAG TPA: TonB-dependent receptor [Flavobacterium sp.]|uniref:TonB-dependent receptor family protein n=1 Tax=Flavobacterium sp. TaxID=239 RepID=UPI0025C2BB7B|nr:TonB-dependent receptor [Flavobacterium sp.]HRL70216.1 TonB-dependent receptor [Flavobacterium sp.]HRM12314.1 TonB-dependent receptor [Flavobacterium sp.]HRM45141.1 TonB-dependent receptor [Flavobacterium sp.]